MNIIASVTPNKTKFGPLLYPGELEKGVQELSELGYEGIELSLRTPEDVDSSDLTDLLEKYDMKLFSIATGQSFIEDGYALFHEVSEYREKAVNRIKGYIDIVATVHGSVIIGGIRGKLNASDTGGQYTAGCVAVDTCLLYAEKKKVVLLLEALNRYETNLFNSLRSCFDFVKLRNSEYLKILPDTFHMNIEEASLKGSLNQIAEYIGAIHCADNNRLAPGMGHVDFAEVLSDVHRYAHLSYLGIEVLPLPDSRKCAETAINTIKKCLHMDA
jgi:sugar phosphate isomerase/epimerase